MKHLMRYEGFSPQERQDEILDKITKYGIDSLSHDDREFLDSYSKGEEEKTHNKLKYSDSEKIFEDDNGLFRFEFESLEDYGDEVHILGTIYVPDLELEDGKRLEGRLDGRIVYYTDGQISPDFYAKDVQRGKDVYYDIFEFCNGLEYELDSFLDYVTSEIIKSDSEK